MTSRLMLHDISRDGHVLLTIFNASTNFISQTPGETKERDLSWLDQGLLNDFSPDGKTILLEYWGEGTGINSAAYLRQTDGSPAVRLGDGASPRLSPDGKWALTVHFTPPQLVLLPTGAGEARRLERGPIEQYGWGAIWVPDGKRVVFQGREPGHDFRCYVQSIEGGEPRPITSEGTIEGIWISPDGRLVIASDARSRASFYPVDGAAADSASGERRWIIGWSSDGHSLYVARTNEMSIRVYRFDPLTGRRELLKEVAPPDPAGIIGPTLFL